MEDDKTIGNSDWLSEYDLALEDRVHCDTLDCPNPATRYATVKCCGAVVLCCAACMSGMYLNLTWMVKTGKAVACKTCQKRNNPENWLSKAQLI